MPVWSTEGLPERAQFSFWREVICEAFAALDPKPVVPRVSFPSRVALGSIGAVNVAQIASCAQIVCRGSDQIRIDPQDRLFVNLQLAGVGRVTQGDRVASMTAGSFSVVDTARPYRLEFDGDFEVMSFRVPRQHLLPLVESPDTFFARRMGDDQGIGRVAVGFMRLLMDAVDTLPSDRTGELATHLCQLVASASQPDIAINKATARDALRKRFIKQAVAYLEAVLDDPQLSVTTLARRFGVSVRYVQQAFADSGLTVAACIRKRRLERCARDLANPHDKRTIAVIACGWGFVDIPHFTRVFGRRYGCSPGVFRSRVRIS